MPTNDERREVAAKLRDKAGRVCFDGCEVEECLFSGDWRYSYSAGDGARSYMRLADLIDPTEHERTVADNRRIIDRNRELECELKACKAKLGDVSRLTNALEGEADDGTWEGARIAADRHIVACWIKEAIG